MIQRWWLAGVLLLITVGLAVLPARLPVFYISQEGHDWHEVVVHGDRQARQTFISHYPGLYVVVLQPFDPWPPDDQPITLRLRELGPGGRERLVLTQTVRELRRGNQLTFTFTPLDDTAGKPYAIEVETTGSVPLRLVAHSEDLYTGGEMPGGGDLMFTIRYNGLLWPTLHAALGRLAADKPGPLSWPWLYVGLGGAYTLLLGATLLALARHSLPPLQAPSVREASQVGGPE